MSRQKNVLYLSPLVPATSGSGGARVIGAHLLALLAAGHTVHVVVGNLHTAAHPALPVQDGLTIEVFPVPLAVANRPAWRILALTLLDRRPWNAARQASSAARARACSLLQQQRWDLVVVDHLSAYPLIERCPRRVPLLYVAHNREADQLRQEWQSSSGLRALFAWLTWRRMMRYERALLQDAEHVVALSAADAHRLQQHCPVAIQVCLPLPPIRTLERGAVDPGVLLFVGSAGHLPNREAVTWLLEQLMPVLARRCPGVHLRIVGMRASDVAGAAVPWNVTFLGFLPETELRAQQMAAALFVAPILAGGGVKVKLLEAASLGLPILATPQAMAGLEFLQNAVRCAEREPAAYAEIIAGLLADQDRLKALGQAARDTLEQQRLRCPDLAAVIADVL